MPPEPQAIPASLPPIHRHIIQISTTAENKSVYFTITALCDDGTVWTISQLQGNAWSPWEQIPPINSPS